MKPLPRKHYLLFALFYLLCIGSANASTIELLSNRGFESGNNGVWRANTLSGSMAAGVVAGDFPRTGGIWYGYVGNSVSSIGSLFQVVLVPANAGIATITFYLNVSSSETISSAFDVMDVNLRTASPDTLIFKLGTFSNLHKAANGVYTKREFTYDLTAYRNQLILLQFYAVNDVSFSTIFRIDDVSMSVVVADAPPTPSGFSASATSTRITLNWNNVSGETDYELQWATDSAGPWNALGIAAQNATSFADNRASAGILYWYRIRARSGNGNSDWSAAIFSTLDLPPFATTQGVSDITSQSAKFNATINPRGVTTIARFEYGLTASYGNSTPWSSDIHGTSSQTYSAPVSGLSANTLYHVRVVAVNVFEQMREGDDVTFTTTSLVTAPAVVTGSASALSSGSATLNGTVNPHGGATTYYFEYGLTTAYGSQTAGASAGSGTSATSVSKSVPALAANTDYHYRLVAANSAGTTPGLDRTFRTASAPIARIDGPSSVGYGQPATFSGAGSSGAASLTYLWNFADGASQSSGSPTVTHTFPNVNGSATYYVTLRVSDADRTSSPRTHPVTVTGQSLGTAPQTSKSPDPVNLANGNYLYEHTDRRYPSPGFPFEFKRFYNSRDNLSTNLPCGYGWTHSYNIKVLKTSTNAIVTFGDGHQELHLWTNDSYQAEAGVYSILQTNQNESLTMLTKQQMRYTFDNVGRLVSITDRNTNTLTLSYEPSGLLSAIYDTAGRTNTLFYNTTNCLMALVDPILRTNRFEYDGNTNLVKAIDANDGTNRFEYDNNHQMTGAYDANGNKFVSNIYDDQQRVVTTQKDALQFETAFIYDFSNRITLQSNALGQVSYHYHDEKTRVTNIIDELQFRTAFAYDSNNNRTLVIDKRGNPTSFGYDERGNVTNKTDALTNITSIEYDVLNNPIRRVDALTNSTTFGYDSVGNLTSTTNALHQVNRVQYSNGLPTVLTDRRGFSTTNEYDAHGNLKTIVDPKHFTNRFDFDGVGRKLRHIDPLKHTNSFFYDNNDNLTLTLNALDQVTFYTYDANNNRTSIRDPRNAVTTNRFDVKDRLTNTANALQFETTTEFDSLDRVTASIAPRNNRTSYAYDDVGNRVRVTNALDQVTRFTFDGNGNQTSVIDPSGRYTTNIFDALNRLISSTDAETNTISTAYDALSHVLATTNAIAQVTLIRYDAIGRLTNVIAATTNTVYFDYDENGNRIHFTNPRGHTWTNEFNELNQLVVQSDPVGRKTTFSYNPAGNLTNTVTANEISIFRSYDELNRLRQITYPAGEPVTFIYDAVGNCTNMTDSVGTTTWTYDLLNRLLTVTDPYGKTVTNGFDAAGNRVVLRYPDNLSVRYGYDSLNRMVALTNWLDGVVTYGYDDRGNLIGSTNANNSTATYGYDAANRLVGLTNAHADASVIASYALTLDGIGNHVQSLKIQPLFPILVNQTNTYAYDADNRLTAVDGRSVTHDNNGNLTVIGSETFNYDFENRLIQFTLTNFTGACVYDGLGSRLAATTNHVPRRFVLDRLGSLTQVLLETDTNGVALTRYVFGLGLAQRITPAGSVSSYHFDIRGNTIAITDSAGTISDSYAFDSFGVLANREGNSPQPFRYLGRYGIIDDSSGLYFARARHFSPQLGRFLTKDPLTGRDSDTQSLNRYVYSLNNALRFQDVSGLSTQESSDNLARSSFWPSFGLLDEAALIILGYWLNGTGGELILTGPEWQKYLGNNAFLADQIANRLREDAEARRSSGNIALSFHADLDSGGSGSASGYRSGTGLLGGSNRDVGDFQITGSATVIPSNNNGRRVSYELTYQWNDIIDPNRNYTRDTIYSTILRAVSGFDAQDYIIRIKWGGSTSFLLD